MWKAYQNLSVCQNFSTGQPAKSLWGCFLWKGYQNLSPCLNFPTGQPAKHVGVFFVESLPKPVTMPALSNWSAGKSCGVFFSGKVTKTCRNARTFKQVSQQKRVGVFFCRKFTKTCRHARTFQLVSQGKLVEVFFVESLQKPVAMPELSNWSAMTELSNWSASKACGSVFFCLKLTKTCPHARTFQLVSQQSLWGCFLCETLAKTSRHDTTIKLVSHAARTFQLDCQQCLRGCFFLESLPKPVAMPEISN